MAVRDDRSDVKQTTTGFRGNTAYGVIPHLYPKANSYPDRLSSTRLVFHCKSVGIFVYGG